MVPRLAAKDYVHRHRRPRPRRGAENLFPRILYGRARILGVIGRTHNDSNSRGGQHLVATRLTLTDGNPTRVSRFHRSE